MAFPGLVAANNLSDTENKEVVWDNLGNGINAVIVATNSIRNNTMVGAVAGTPGTTPTNWTGTGSPVNGLTRQIVGVGTEDEITYIDYRFFGTTTSAGFHAINPETIGQVAAVLGQSWTLSQYISLVAGSTANISLIDQGINEYSSALEILTIGSFPVAVSAGSLSSNRKILTRTLTNALTASVHPFFAFNYSSGVAIDITFRIGLPQLEQGGYLTSPIATTNAPVSALATVSLAIEGDDILELVGARIASVADFVRIKGLVTPAQPRLTTAAANAGSGIALRDDALVKASPSSEGDFFITRGTLDGQSLRVNGLGIASISGSPFSGSTASCPLSISSFAAPTNLRLNNAMTSGTLAFPEKAIPIETNDFILYAKAGQS